MSHRLLLPHARDTVQPVRVEKEAFHHLRVLRLRPGDSLEVFNGKGRAWPAEVLAFEADSALLRLGPGHTALAGRAISLVQALPKADKLELVLQKGTELGAHAFYPALSERSLVRLAASTAEARRTRWQRIADEAARQCGRADSPRVFAVQGLLEAVRALPPETRVLVLDEEEETLGLAQAASADAHAPLALVVGPEGGLARTEVDALRALGGVTVSLGPLVLRTETAALAALAVLRHREGLLG
ncbi:MAG: RsmE family RNA methyltransferase [Myxococcaceae bacterium]